MTKASNRLTSLLHRLGAGRRARFDAFVGTGAPAPALHGTSAPAPAPRRQAFLALAVLVPILAALALSASPAAANEGWWHLGSGARPTYLHPGAGQNETMELTATATGGDVLWLEAFSPPFPSVAFPYNASHGEIQSALEGLYGAGNVGVTGGPADTANGNILGAATVSGNLTENSPVVEGVTDVIGKLGIGQPVTGEHIPGGTKVLSVNVGAGTVTLSANAAETAEGVVLTGGGASTTVEGFTVTSGGFVVGQEVTGGGIAPGTKLEAIDVAAHTATLSQPPAHSETPTVISSATAPYIITFKGALGGRPVALPENAFGDGGLADLVPGIPLEGTASVTQTTEGSPDGELVVTAENVGDAAISGGGCELVGEGQGKYTNSACTEPEGGAPGAGDYEKTPIRILDRLPAGVHATQATGWAPTSNGSGEFPCQVRSPSLVSCEQDGQLRPFIGLIEVRIGVVVTASVPSSSINESEVNEVTVEGGHSAVASIRRPIKLSRESVPFGVEAYELDAEEEGGAADTRAGSHPFQLTNVLNINQRPESLPVTDIAEPHASGMLRDLSFKWPAGLIGNPQAVARCPLGTFLKFEGGKNKCPVNTAVGIAHILLFEPAVRTIWATVPFFNLETQAGEPARFGFLAEETPVIITPSIRDGEDYGVTVNVDNTSQTVELISSTVTVWGDPGAPVHAELRGWNCFEETTREGVEGCDESPEAKAPPFIAMPASCPVKENPVTHESEPEQLYSSVEGDSWEQANEQQAHGERPTLQPFGSIEMPAMQGCNQLPFTPTIQVTPDVTDGSSASGLRVDVHVPQEESVNPEGLAEGEPRNITVALPAGVQINPSGGNGLQACSEGLVGYQGKRELQTQPDTQTSIFSPYLPGSLIAKENGEEEPFQAGVNFCPDAAKIGTVRIHLPVLANDVEGAVYLASQNENPFGGLIAMYIVAEDPAAGVTAKLPGEVNLCESVGQIIDGLRCEALGQIITRFENNPQAPFEDAEFHFFGGEKAPLATPARCGNYTTTAAFTPWSAESNPAHPEAPHIATASFPITSGPDGGPCPGAALPFSPELTGGALNLQAGEFSPFTLTLTRHDGEQNMQSVVAHLPLGMSGYLSHVQQCPEPQANLGECPAGSLIGESTVGVGVGGHPFTVSGGKFYLTGPYNGTGGCTVGTPGCAPFGVTFEVPAKAGPFDLERNSANPAGEDACDCVVVRGKIEINPETAAITVTSNPPGTPDAIPTSIEGIPLEIQHINATTTRGNFQFNPSNCSKLQASGTIHSSEGNNDTVSVPFQVTNCASLKFEPKVAISTSGKTSKANGASLTYKLTYPNVPQGTDADIHYVKVELPKALPSRLTTLQKACTQKQFKENPAGCPSASLIGHAKAIVPNIPVPLEGPVYFVSNGGEAFPNLVIVLQGYNVTIDLVGDTFISKSGITSTTFKTVPDNPVYSFEITLPEGPYSALAANGNLCKLTTTKTVKKQVKVKVKGHEKTEVRNVKEQVSAALSMPNEYIAQNGAKVNTTVPITVTGCGKTVKTTKHKKKKKNARKSSNNKGRA